MAITLPYEFDTSDTVKLIIRGLLILLGVVLIGIFYSLLVSRDTTAVMGLIFTAAILLYFCKLFLGHLVGSEGTITAQDVIVQPGRVLGLRLAGPGGRFPISQFKGVRVERVTNPIGIPLETQIRPHERVYLAGSSGAPDILIARTSRDAGRTLANELALALKLPYLEQIAPY